MKISTSIALVLLSTPLQAEITHEACDAVMEFTLMDKIEEYFADERRWACRQQPSTLVAYMKSRTAEPISSAPAYLYGPLSYYPGPEFSGGIDETEAWVRSWQDHNCDGVWTGSILEAWKQCVDGAAGQDQTGTTGSQAGEP